MTGSTQAKPPYGASLNRAHPLAQGLTGCFLANENGGLKLFNLAYSFGTGVNVAGTIAGATWQQKMAGTCLNFTGASTDNVVVGDICNAAANVGRMTVVACVQRNATSALGQCIVGKEALTAKGWSFQISSGNVLVFGNFGGASYPLVSGSETITDLTKPYVVAGTKHSANGYAVYVNGRLDATAANGAAPETDTTSLTFGAYASGTTLQLFNGKIFWCYIWTNRCLNGGDILSLSKDPYQFIYSAKRRRLVTQQAASAPADGWGALLSTKRNRLVYA